MEKNIIPTISVLMPVYNAGIYLGSAIESILNQTFKNFELIIINDGSTDESLSTIKRYAKKDQRIRLVSRPNKGLVATLNEGIGLAKAEYIARMDADDISVPSRLKLQLDYLKNHPRCGAVGSSFSVIDENDKATDTSYHLTQNVDLQTELFLRNPFGHGTMLIRKEALLSIGGYDKTQAIEDYDIWYRLSKKWELANIPKPLYKWRVLETSMSHADASKRYTPLSKLMATIWENTTLRVPGPIRILTTSLYYKQLGEGYYQQYKFMLFCLWFALYKKNRFILSAYLFVALLLRYRSLPLFKLVASTQTVHNYNLGNLTK